MGLIAEKVYTKGVVSKTADIPIDPIGERLDIEVSCDKWPKDQIGHIRIMAAFGSQEIAFMEAANLSGGFIDPKTDKPATSIKFRGDWDRFYNPDTGEQFLLKPDRVWVELDLSPTLKDDIQTQIIYDTSKLK
jgi:hypothetical protein